MESDLNTIQQLTGTATPGTGSTTTTTTAPNHPAARQGHDIDHRRQGLHVDHHRQGLDVDYRPRSRRPRRHRRHRPPRRRHRLLHPSGCPAQNDGGEPVLSLLAHGAGWSSLVARRAHNPKVGGSNPPPATIETLVGAVSCIGHRRLTSGFAFGPRSKIGVYRGFFSGPTISPTAKSRQGRSEPTSAVFSPPRHDEPGLVGGDHCLGAVT